MRVPWTVSGLFKSGPSPRPKAPPRPPRPPPRPPPPRPPPNPRDIGHPRYKVDKNEDREGQGRAADLASEKCGHASGNLCKLLAGNSLLGALLCAKVWSVLKLWSVAFQPTASQSYALMSDKKNEEGTAPEGSSDSGNNTQDRSSLMKIIGKAIGLGTQLSRSPLVLSACEFVKLVGSPQARLLGALPCSCVSCPS